MWKGVRGIHPRLKFRRGTLPYLIEIIYKKEYFTVNLSVNCLINKEIGFICIASNNLISLKKHYLKNIGEK